MVREQRSRPRSCLHRHAGERRRSRSTWRHHFVWTRFNRHEFARGGRIRASLWFDDPGIYGIDGSFLFLGNRDGNTLFNSNTTPVLSRPVFVLNNGMENAETVAFPNFSTGTLRIDPRSQFSGADINVFRRFCCGCDRTFALFAGYRYLNLTESITITESITAGAGAPDPIGTHTVVTDSFATRNSFNGGQLGAYFEQRYNSWFVNLRASTALGVNQQTITVDGSQVRIRPGQAPEFFRGGLLAANSNIGR